jgi:hypothetical protein
VSVAWLIAAVLLLGLIGVAIFDMRRVRREPDRSSGTRDLNRIA